MQVPEINILAGEPGHFLATFSVGVFLHIALFHHGEWDLYATKLIVASAVIPAALTGALTYLEHNALVYSPQIAIIAFGHMLALLAGTFTSILIYRAAFHRLNKFPGPFAARLSNFFAMAVAAKGLKTHREIQKLHEKHGDFVRIGPSEISITHPKATHIIHSNSSVCLKGPWYNIIHPQVSLLSIRDKKDHSRRRKIWDKAFNAKALRDYEPRVNMYTGQLLRQIEKREGQPFDATEWFNYYTFDIMGDLAFGRSFDMLKEGVRHYYMKLFHSNMILFALFGKLIWLFQVFKATPLINGAHLDFQRWLAEQVSQRRKNKPDVSDVFSFILDDYETVSNPTQQDLENLQGDAHLIVVAGSDTTASSLTSLFYQLARHPEVCKKLREEVDAYKKEHEQPDYSALFKMKYLQACIDESLRLNPVVPSGVQRMTPPEGLQIGDTFIPGNTIMQIPMYTLYRDERVFPKANEFIPERWLTQPELIQEASCYAPFSMGRLSCVGKQLGLMEIRTVTAEVLSRYDIEFAPGYKPESFEANMQDCFTLAVPELKMIFNSRK